MAVNLWYFSFLYTHTHTHTHTHARAHTQFTAHTIYYMYHLLHIFTIKCAKLYFLQNLFLEIITSTRHFFLPLIKSVNLYNSGHKHHECSQMTHHKNKYSRFHVNTVAYLQQCVYMNESLHASLIICRGCM